MDVTPTQHQDPASSDDELAKVLAGIGGNDDHKQAGAIDGLQFEETPAAPAAKEAEAQLPTPAVATPAATSVPAAVEPTSPIPTPESTATTPAVPPLSVPSVGGSNLEGLKKTALEELRPLIGKLNLPAEDKFDTYLLIIRSTDDQSLLEPAHEAAKEIPDEAKRAQALLDIIKEIDYFNNQSAVSQ